MYNVYGLTAHSGKVPPTPGSSEVRTDSHHDLETFKYYEFGHLEGLFDPEHSFEARERAVREFRRLHGGPEDPLSLQHAHEWAKTWQLARKSTKDWPNSSR